MPEVPTDLANALQDRYRLERELGRGGMATVYLAEDLKHHRRVAVKVLHPGLAGALGSERFVREIETVAALRHPHIMPLYDSGRVPGAGADGDVLFQVMPLAEGESLRDRLRREGRLSIDEALRIAAEVSDALSYAHHQGIIHRDIKPENILLESGHAVVADFGIARAIDAASDSRLTGTGISVGTPAYMSPEQVAGERDVDARSDVYGLGCVLYEMLAGEPPFTGATAANVIRQQMTADPTPLTLRRAEAGADVAAVVDRALAKEPADRWRDAQELRIALEGLRTRGAPRDDQAPSRPSRWMPLIAGAGAIGLIGVAALLLLRRDVRDIEIGRRTQATLGPGLEVHPALSPNGELLAYTAGRDARLFVRQIDGGTAIPVARDIPGLQGWPRWSPDGRQLSFSSSRGLEVVPALGGVPRLLARAPLGGGGMGTLIIGGSWSPDGREVAFVRGDTLYAATVEGAGTRRILTVPRLHSCAWSPDGRRIACVRGNPEATTLGPLLGNVAQSDILIVPAAGGEPQYLEHDASSNASPAWMPDGTLLFISNRDGGRDVYSVRLTSSGRAAGAPRRITTGLNALAITVSADGSRMGYAAFAETSNIWSMPVPAGTATTMSGATQLTTGSQLIEWFDISADGRWLAFDSDRTGNAEIYRMPLDGTAEPERLTRDSVDKFYPQYSPDGREIAFHSFREGHRQAFVMPAEGGARQLVAKTERDDRTVVWMPDGRGMLVLSNFGSPGTETRFIPRAADGRWGAPVRWRMPPCMATWAPDGKLAACSDFDGRLLLVDQRGGVVRTIVESGLIRDVGLFPQWSSDGRTVFYLGADSGGTTINAVPAAGGASHLVARFDPARPWHRFGFRAFRDRLFFTIGDRESHVWVAELGARSR